MLLSSFSWVHGWWWRKTLQFSYLSPPPPQRSWNKVMFLHPCVILFRGVCVSPSMQSGGVHSLWADTPLPPRTATEVGFTVKLHTRGKYPSLWIAGRVQTRSCFRIFSIFINNFSRDASTIKYQYCKLRRFQWVRFLPSHNIFQNVYIIIFHLNFIQMLNII